MQHGPFNTIDCININRFATDACSEADVRRSDSRQFQ